MCQYDRKFFDWTNENGKKWRNQMENWSINQIENFSLYKMETAPSLIQIVENEKDVW